MHVTLQTVKTGKKSALGVPANNFLFSRRVPANNFLFAGRVPANNFLFAGRILANNFLFVGRVPANNLFQNVIQEPEKRFRPNNIRQRLESKFKIQNFSHSPH